MYDWSAFTKREHQIIINTLDNLDDKNGEEAIVKDLILRTMDAPFYRDKVYVHQVNKFDIYRAVRAFDLYGDKQHYLFAEAYDNLTIWIENVQKDAFHNHARFTLTKAINEKKSND